MSDSQGYSPFEFEINFDNWITNPQYNSDDEQIQFGMGPGYSGGTSGADAYTGYYNFQDSDWVTNNLLSGITGSSFLNMWDPAAAGGYGTGGQSPEDMAAAFGGYGFGSGASQGAIDHFSDENASLFEAWMASQPYAGGADSIGAPWSYANLANVAGTAIANDMLAWEDKVSGIQDIFDFQSSDLEYANEQSSQDMLAQKGETQAGLAQATSNLYRTATPGLQSLKRKAGNTGFVGNTRANREFDLTLENVQGNLNKFGMQSQEASSTYISQLEELLNEYEFQQGNLQADYDTDMSQTNLGYQANIEGYISDFESGAYDMTAQWFTDFEMSLSDLGAGSYGDDGEMWNLYNPGEDLATGGGI